MLASRLGGAEPSRRILDLACGEGHLLALLDERGFTPLWGLDRSEDELAVARRRVGPAVELVHADARSMPLPTGGFDVVLCHMALMLIAPAEAVLDEIARILRFGGELVALTNRKIDDPAYDALLHRIRGITAEAGLPRLRLGDPRFLARSGLAQLFCHPRYDERSLTIEDFEVHARLPPARLWPPLQTMYDIVRLPQALQAELEARVLEEWSLLTDPDGMVHCSQGMRLISVRTAR